jgi:hypothetical protein
MGWERLGAPRPKRKSERRRMATSAAPEPGSEPITTGIDPRQSIMMNVTRPMLSPSPPPEKTRERVKSGRGTEQRPSAITV